ncbi:MAG TPA: winged helix-turn-helix domain-containing protein [Bryobacteraceae bacterium]|nr:winged helix-turn-helix domain-containing protein [Bryobacteraceae bacterium]
MSESPKDYQFGGFRISTGERVLRRHGQVVPLTPKCFDTLLVLAEHAGTVVKRETLIREVWPDTFVEDGNLSQNIFTLRKILGETSDGGLYIETIPKRGYRLVIPPSPAAAAPSSRPSAHRAGWYLLAATLLIAAIVAAARWVRPSTEPAPAGVRTVRLIVPNSILYGIISPDGKQIAYAAAEASGESLWVRETSGVGSGTRLFGPLPGSFWGISYSPNGAYLYFTVEDDFHPAMGTLFRAPSRGGDVRKLISGVSSAPAFSPDGSRIVFKRYDFSDRGYLLTATALGADPKVIAQSTASYAFNNYQWAPDGNSIYYVEGTRLSRGSKWSFWKLPASGGAPVLVRGPQPHPLRSVNWLNRSEILALIPDEDSGGSQIWRLGAGTSARRITNDISDYFQISLTADGGTLLANSRETQDSVWTASAPGTPATEPVRLSLPPGSYDHPAWTPDGHVVFVGQSNLWVASADGANRKPLLPEKSTVSEPAVSPDGRFVVFAWHHQGTRNLWRIGMHGEGLRQLTAGRFDWHPALSPDGKWVVYASYSQGQRALYKAPLDGSAAPLRLVGAGGTDLAVSPDGKLFACANDSGETEVRSFGDGALMRKFTDPVGAANFHWSRDGKNLTFISTLETPLQFWSVALAGGSPQRIGASLPGNLVELDWSRDAARIVYLRREVRVDLALMTNIQ